MVSVTSQEKFVTVNNLRLRYLDWGTEGKMPLLCLHGHTGQAHIWDEFAEAMSPHYHVLSLDQRGHGESQWADTGYERDRFVEDLTAFVDELGLQRFVLAGLSMGGWHSLLYTPNHQDRVERIIIVDIGPEPSPRSIADRANRPATPMEFSSLDDAVAWMLETNPWATPERTRQDAVDKMRQKDDGSWTWKADSSLYNMTLTDLTSRELQQRYWKAVEAITCPILEVRGAESTLVSDEVIQRMIAVGQNFTSIDVPGAGHVVTVDKPQEFIEVTRGFLGVVA
jgi:pimeloyl-ACP methyl ester carboxylesterase